MKKSDLPIPPGEYLREVLAEMGINQSELARRTNRTYAEMSRICTGKRAITPRTAIDLERETRIRAEIWMRVEAEYRLELERRKK